MMISPQVNRVLMMAADPETRRKVVSSPDYTGYDRRNGNGNGWTSLRAWSQAIGIVGIPGAIAIFLVYMGATQFPIIVKQIEQLILEQHQTQKMLEKNAERDDMILRAIQRTCSNMARTEDMRQNCFDR